MTENLKNLVTVKKLITNEMNWMNWKRNRIFLKRQYYVKLATGIFLGEDDF